jgi:hypothetical protein
MEGSCWGVAFGSQIGPSFTDTATGPILRRLRLYR